MVPCQTVISIMSGLSSTDRWKEVGSPPIRLGFDRKDSVNRLKGDSALSAEAAGQFKPGNRVFREFDQGSAEHINSPSQAPHGREPGKDGRTGEVVRSKLAGKHVRPGPSGLVQVFSGLFALAVWQVAAMLLDKSLFLASPVDVARRLVSLFGEADFARVIIFSFTRILSGYLLALAAGTVTAVIASRFYAVEVLLRPFVSAIKSVPVASFIILCLIWLSSRSLSVFISFLMVFPIIYTNMLSGIKSVGHELLEMAWIFKVGWLRKAKYIHLPHLKPYILSACSVSMGLAWKAGVAAEVIGIPDGSIGEKLYEAKVYLDSADLFAWTVVIVAVSVLFERLVLSFITWLFASLERS